MTMQEIQQQVIEHIDTSLQNQVHLRDRINLVFGNWFRGLLQAAAAVNMPLPPPGEGGQSVPPAGGASPA